MEIAAFQHVAQASDVDIQHVTQAIDVGIPHVAQAERDCENNPNQPLPTPTSETGISLDGASMPTPTFEEGIFSEEVSMPTPTF